MSPNSQTLLRQFQSTAQVLQPGSTRHHNVQNIGRGRCYRKEQTFCGLNGLLEDDMPVSRGSCWAFWRQNCCRSAAAWDTLTLLMPASRRSCWTSFFIAMILDEPDMVKSLRECSLNNDEYKTLTNSSLLAALAC